MSDKHSLMAGSLENLRDDNIIYRQLCLLGEERQFENIRVIYNSSGTTAGQVSPFFYELG